MPLRCTIPAMTLILPLVASTVVLAGDDVGPLVRSLQGGRVEGLHAVPGPQD